MDRERDLERDRELTLDPPDATMGERVPDLVADLEEIETLPLPLGENVTL